MIQLEIDTKTQIRYWGNLKSIQKLRWSIDGIWNQYESKAISKLCNCWHKLCQVKGESAFDTFDFVIILVIWFLLHCHHNTFVLIVVIRIYLILSSSLSKILLSSLRKTIWLFHHENQNCHFNKLLSSATVGRVQELQKVVITLLFPFMIIVINLIIVINFTVVINFIVVIIVIIVIIVIK